MTAVRALLAEATRRLAQARVASPDVDARLLLAHCLGVEPARLALVDDVGPHAAARFAALVARRGLREPLQHVTGTVAFRTVELAVGPGVFVPRPETELLVDAVLAVLRERPDAVAVDLCSGSGALALAIAAEAPAARVYAVERSRAALRWLHRNAEASAVEIVAADVADPGLLRGLHGCADVVVANPPYVPAGTPVDPEVDADPAEAVFAGADGLAVLPHVIARAAQLLRPGGVVAIEHDETHAAQVRELMRACGGWDDVATHDDLTGRPRYVTARRVGKRHHGSAGSL